MTPFGYYNLLILTDAIYTTRMSSLCFLLFFFFYLLVTGLKYGIKACCGYGGGDYNFDPKAYCGNSKVINGSRVTSTACIDPYNYVSWDGIHATEAANKLTTFAILNGSYSDPPFPFHERCDLQPIG